MNETSVLAQDVKKYFDYFFETKGFTRDTQTKSISQQALQAAKLIRGFSPGPVIRERKPTIMIQGIMPRSGSVYVGELMRLHSDLFAYPYHLFEFPALQLTNDVKDLQKKFLLGYKPNIGKLAGDDFLPIFGAALMGYLQVPVPPEQRVLVKMPNVQYLSHFFSMFPYENVLILIRDGRDVVHSTLRTWPRLNFLQVCLRWNRSAQAILRTIKQFQATNQQGYWLARFEDALRDPETFVKQACQQFDLDEDRYPWEKIDTIRVIGSSKQHDVGKVDWSVHKVKPENFKPTQYWQKWSVIKRVVFKVVAGKSLVELGYCEDMNW